VLLTKSFEPSESFEVTTRSEASERFGLQARSLCMNGVVSKMGLVVVDSSLNTLAANAEAINILAFPHPAEKFGSLGGWLTSKVRADLVDARSAELSAFVAEFRSARRAYLCRSFPLNVRLTSRTSVGPVAVLVLERKSNAGISTAELGERFGLTPREQQTVQGLLQGLTSKEIAERTKISPNTVKAFIRLVMVKMNVSTRSGIIGKLVEPKFPFRHLI
jgi:DNA-binding CsgD family transcriptional regulator